MNKHFIETYALILHALITEKNERKMWQETRVYQTKLDNKGFIIELEDNELSNQFLQFVINDLLLKTDTYGIKRYATRKTIALRVSLTGSI